MSVFKCAYTRGIAEKLAREGVVKFASAESAEKIADEVGLSLNHEPVTDGPVPADKTAALIVAIMEKAAASTSTLIVGGVSEQANSPENAAQHSSLGALDLKNRGVGDYAKGVHGVGKTEQPTKMLGTEMTHPKAPATTDHRPNTVNKAAADLTQMIRKIAEGSGTLIEGGKKDQENTPEESAQHSSLGALDQKQRPTSEYVKGEHGVGKTDQPTAPVGKEEDHPKKPGTTDAGSNSATEQSHKSAAFLSLFEETAKKYISKIASIKDENEKVATVKKLMSMDEDEASDFLAKAASELPAPLAEAHEAHEKKETTEEEHSEHKDEEKKEESKKEARHGREYKDAYGYSGYDGNKNGYKAGKNSKQGGGGAQKTAALFSALKGLASK